MWFMAAADVLYSLHFQEDLLNTFRVSPFLLLICLIFCIILNQADNAFLRVG